MRDLFGAQDGLQNAGRLCAECGERGRLVGGAQLRKDNFESRVLLMPAGNVGLANRAKNGGHGFVQQIVAPLFGIDRSSNINTKSLRDRSARLRSKQRREGTSARAEAHASRSKTRSWTD